MFYVSDCELGWWLCSQVGGVFFYSDWGYVTIDGNFYDNVMLCKTPSLNTSAFQSIVTQEAAVIGALLQY